MCLLSLTLTNPLIYCDEPCYLGGGHFYWLALKGDFKNPVWSEVAAYDHQHLAEYIYGAAMHVRSGKLITLPGGMEDWHYGYLAQELTPLLKQQALLNPDDGHIARLRAYVAQEAAKVHPGKATALTETDFLTGRFVSLSFGFLLALLIGILTAMGYRHAMAGICASAIFFLSPLAATCFTIVMTDSICFFFVLGTLIALVYLARELAKNQPWDKKTMYATAACAVLLALALSTKLSAIYLLMVIIPVFMLRGKPEHAGPCGKNVFVWKAGLFMAAGIICAAICILLNPYFYADPVGRILKMAHYRSMIMQTQIVVREQVRLNNGFERAAAFVMHGILLDYRFGTAAIMFYLTLWLSGLTFIIRQFQKEWRAGKPDVFFVIFIWIAASFLFDMATVQLNWARYYLPSAVATAAIIGSGCAASLKLIIEYCRSGNFESAFDMAFLRTWADGPAPAACDKNPGLCNRKM